MAMSNLSKECFRVRVSCMTYNHAKFIQDTMNGFCMQQTDFPFICTIFDDNSNDGEQDVIKKYLDNNFIMNDDTIKMTNETDDYTLIYTRHKTNANCFFAVYFLKYNHYQLKKSRNPYLLQEWKDTKYIALCEGDDYWTDPLKLQKQVSFLENHPNYAICTHDFFYFDQDKFEFKKGTPFSYIFAKANNRMFFDYSLDVYFEGWWTHPLSCLYRNGQYLKEIPYIHYKAFRDDILFYYILKEGKGALLRDVMGVYRIHGSGVWSKLSYIDKKEASMNNAYDIYLVEHDRNAFKKIIRIQYDVLLYLKKEGSTCDYFKKLRKYLKMDPFLFFYKLMWSITKLDLSIIYNKLKAFF